MKKEDVTVLIVDDSEHIRALFAVTLKKLGIGTVVMAANGEEGVEQFQKTNPSIVFLDNLMPKMNGLEALKQMRTLRPDAVVVMLSAVTSMDVVKEAKERGASFYLVKPYTQAKVVEIIQKFLGVEGLTP